MHTYRRTSIAWGVALTAILSATLLVSTQAIAAYAATTNQLTVRAYTMDGRALSMYATIKSGSSTVMSGFTPITYTGTTANTYSVEVQNYNSLTFSKWGDGSTGNPRSINLSADTTAVAYYNEGTVSSATSACTTSEPVAVVANGNDGNIPANTLDNNLSTRWSNNGVGSWIQYDLGQSQTVCDAKIAWYRGNERQSNFVISLSTDGQSYRDVYSGKSSGTTLNEEVYNFADAAARYVRLTVNGNSMNSWASITETNISGAGTGTSTVSEPPVSSTADKFGVKMLYPTKSSGQQWFMNMADPDSDPRFDPQNTIYLNSDGSWNMRSTKVRMNVFTTDGYHPERITTYNQQELAKKGYMQDPSDWKNIEITGYVKVNSSPSNDNFAWYARGGRHTDSNGGCEGTSYKGDLFYDGMTRFAKEQQHADGYSFTSKVAATGSLTGKWIGFKTVMYNNAQGNVVLQNWINENLDKVTWKKVTERIDSGGWGSDGDMCGGLPDQKITWGGPIAAFRWDTATNVDFKWLSVREIQPPT